jgi:hypothetical protein
MARRHVKPVVLIHPTLAIMVMSVPEIHANIVEPDMLFHLVVQIRGRVQHVWQVNINHIQLCKEPVICVSLVNTIPTPGRPFVRIVKKVIIKKMKAKQVVKNASKVIMPM